MMKRTGFTLIELIVAITVIALASIPAALISIEAVRNIREGDSRTMATILARRELGVVNTLAFSDVTLAAGYNNLTSNYQGYRYDLRRQVTAVGGTSDLRNVLVTVYPAGESQGLVQLDTYVINTATYTFGLGVAGGAVSPEGGAITTGAGSYNANGQTITVATVSNTSSLGNITVMQLYVWCSQVNKTIQQVNMDGGTNLWTGSLSMPTSQPLSPNIALTASCTIGPSSSVTGNTYVFLSGIGSGQTFYVKYRMYDGTDSATFSYTR